MKWLAGFLIIFLAVVTTTARYSDADFLVRREIAGNAFRAATLDFTSRDAANGEAKKAFFQLPLLKSGGLALAVVRLINEGSLALFLQGNVSLLEGSEACAHLNLSVRRNWQEVYQGHLADFQLALGLAGGQEDLIFVLSRDNGAVASARCSFDFVLESGRSQTGGFSARRVLTNMVVLGK